MRTEPTPRGEAGWREAGAPFALLLAGWVGLQLGPLVLAWRESGPAALLQMNGLGPIELLVVWASAEALWRGAGAGELRAPRWAMLGGALLLLLPSTLLAAAVLLLCGALVAAQSRGAARWGALGFAGLGAIHLLGVLGREPLSVLITWEAWAAHALLAWFEPQATLAGAVIRMPDGHGIAVMPGCSATQLLPPALLALAVMRRAAVPGSPMMRPMLLAALALVGLNLLRLVLLAWSPLAYGWGHGALGTNIFGLFCVAVIQAGAPPSQDAPAPRGAPAIMPALWVMALLALGLGAKVQRAWDQPLAPQAAAMARVAEVMASEGWSARGELRLLADGTLSAGVYRRGACELDLAVLPPGREHLAVLREAWGAEARFLGPTGFTSEPMAPSRWRQLAQHMRWMIGRGPRPAAYLLAGIARGACPEDPWPRVATLRAAGWD